MAVIKCNKCGISSDTEMKECPSCTGQKQNKKRSIVSYLVWTGIILWLIVNIINSNTPTKPTSVNKKNPKVAIANSSWETSTSKDQMTNEKSAYAFSKSVTPTRKMEFPYNDTEAWLGIGHSKDSEWVYIGFNTPPNLIDTETKDGYNIIETRIKWDDQLENVTFIQDWGSKSLHFQNDSSIIMKIMKSESVMVELNWYGEGLTYFKFPLNGSSSAISKARQFIKPTQ